MVFISLTLHTKYCECDCNSAFFSLETEAFKSKEDGRHLDYEYHKKTGEWYFKEPRSNITGDPIERVRQLGLINGCKKCPKGT